MACKEAHACRDPTGGPDFDDLPTYKGLDKKTQLTCCMHGKLRFVDCLVECTEAGYEGQPICFEGKECKTGKSDASGGTFNNLNKDEKVTCSLHGKLRSADCMVDDGTGNPVCAPDK